MGKLTVRFEDLQAVNFDKFCRAALEIVCVRKLSLDGITFVVGGVVPVPFPDGDFVAFDDEASQDYGKRGDEGERCESHQDVLSGQAGRGTGVGVGPVVSGAIVRGR